MADTGTTGTARQTLRRQLGRLGQELESVSAEIWQSIDHNDLAGLERGVAYKQRFNQRRGPLETAAAEMVALLRDYPQSEPGPADYLAAPTAVAASVPQHAVVPTWTPPAAARASHPPTRERTPEAQTPGDLGQKVPLGFVLGGQTFTSTSAWPLFYEALLEELYGRAGEKLSRLADDGSGFVRGGKPLVAHLPDQFDNPLPVVQTLFAEGDLDPADLIEVIKRLLGEVGHPLDGFKILLRIESETSNTRY
jgi:hypothetical protein